MVETKTKKSYYTVKEIQELLGYARPDPIYRYIRHGELRATKPGGNNNNKRHWLIKIDDFENFINSGR